MIALLKSYSLTFLALFIIFLLTLCFVSLIPSAWQDDQLKKTVMTFEEEGQYPPFGLPWRQVGLDNFTDAMMFNTAYAVNEQEPLRSALTNMRAVQQHGEMNQVTNLSALARGEAVQYVRYERYWHGYQVYLRPLMTVFSYQQIRYILFLLLYGGAAWLLYLLYKKLHWQVMIAFLIGLVAVDFFFIWKSLQFSGVFLVAIYSSIYYLLAWDKKKPPYLLFFVVGGLTAFFDLLTAPLISLGFLLIITTWENKKNSIVLTCIAWSVGYLLLWSSKWILVELLYTPGAIMTSLDQIVNRTVNEADQNFSHLQTLKLNFMQLVGYDRRNQIVILIVGALTLLASIKYISFNTIRIHKLLPWVCIVLIPYAWYLVAANHSYLHVWFTYRAQFMTVVALVMIFLQLCVKKNSSSHQS